MIRHPVARVPVALRRVWWLPARIAAMVPRPRFIALGRRVIALPSLVAHQLAHVTQWERHGPTFPFRYAACVIARGHAACGYELEAAAAESDAWYLDWARQVLREAKP